MINYVEYFDIPAKIAIIILSIFFIVQIIGELLEFKGKIVPEFIKVRKYFIRKKNQKKATEEREKNLENLLSDLNEHYSSDNITKRDEWMQWVNNQAKVYDESIEKLNETLSDIRKDLNKNTKMIEDDFIESSRDRVIQFSAKIGDDSIPVSREESNRIFKTYDKYEKFLEEHNMTNGEIDIAMHIIKEAYENRLKTHSFIEDMRGYKK